ncbi:hypothetical protein UCDDA912_g08498 [Diaporthe ampelina]|uniref:2EXR domain-containing protein n=1 Tax=Diaporthe ampelina TaxID=1214573 RepID=A0A0G2HTV7_9PEZI|nr:hypothetical protein UCDDA912_g08498 [Diaporthe ampelina]
MGLPAATALRWERNHEYHIPEGRALSPAVRQVVDFYFATCRTKDWDARLKEYRELHENKIRNPYLREIVEEDPASHQLLSVVETCRQMRRDEFHGFLQLPFEIRDMIYSHALHKGRVIVPNSALATRRVEPVKHYRTNDGFYYKRYEGLEMELLAMEDGRRAPCPLGLIQGVSRAVHDEASRAYFGGNQFIFPAGQFLRPSHCNLRGFYEASGQQASRFHDDLNHRTNNALLLRDVSYTFDMRDHPGDDYANLYRDFAIKDSVDSRALSPAQALQALHDQKTLDLEVDWAERIDSIKRMTLDRLALDLQECYCAVGCCRKAGWVLDRLLYSGPPPGTEDAGDNAYSSINWVGRRPLVVEVTGLVSEDERVMAGAKLGELRIAEVRFSTSYGAPGEIAGGTEGNVHLSQELFLH